MRRDRLDTSDYSFTYVARWSDGDPELMKATAERVIGCAKQILAGLETSDYEEEAQE